MSRPSAPDRSRQRATTARSAAARDNPRDALREASARQAAANQAREAARGAGPMRRTGVGTERAPRPPLGDPRSQPTGHGQRSDRAGAGRPSHSAWRRFTDRWGWRAYALPILVVLTVLALVTTKSPRTVTQVLSGHGFDRPASSDGPAVANPNQQVKSDEPGAGAVNSVLPALQLPPGPAYTTQGSGTFATLPGTSAVIGRGSVHRFSIEVENGLTGVNLQQYAAIVMSALSNPQSWIADGSIALQRVDSGAVDFHVTLVSSMTVRTLCGYDLPVETSCYAQAPDSRVVLNVARWTRGAKAYSSDLATYRTYAVNHEVGHALGHNHSHECLAGGLAPVMMQQTIGTKTASGAICQPNPWPYPKGVKDAPGPEEAGDSPDLDFFRRNSS